MKSHVKAGPTPSFTTVPKDLLQRKCACGGSAGLDGECEECRNKRLQRRAVNGAAPTTVPPIVHEVLRSPGQSLDPATRAFMEPRFGHDFSKVRVHTDAKAAESARAANALAYTVGRDVVFGPRQYAPNTNGGQRLLAHELTHVVQQQAGGGNQGMNLGIIEANDGSFERHANQVAESVSGNLSVIMHPGTAPAAMQRLQSSGRGPCDDNHIAAINTALGEARSWRSRVSMWFEAHLNHIRRAVVGQTSRVGPLVSRELSLLDQHFRTSDIIRDRGSLFPESADERGEVRDFENFGNASYDIRRRFQDIDLSGLTFQCEAPVGEAGLAPMYWEALFPVPAKSRFSQIALTGRLPKGKLA